MANLFRKTYTRALPEGAEVFTRRGKRMSRWTNGLGRTQTAEVSTDGQGVLVNVASQCESRSKKAQPTS